MKKILEVLEQELKACADMADMLDNKMFSLNQAITKIAEEQAKEKEAAKVAEEMKKAGREDVPAGNEQEPKTGNGAGICVREPERSRRVRDEENEDMQADG